MATLDGAADYNGGGCAREVVRGDGAAAAGNEGEAEASGTGESSRPLWVNVSNGHLSVCVAQLSRSDFLSVGGAVQATCRSHRD